MEALGQLAGGVAHDFNNLLTAILGHTEILMASLQEGRPQASMEAIKTGLERVRHAGERAATLTGQLLAFSRKQVSQPQLLDTGHIVTDMQSLLRRLIGERFDLTVRIDPLAAHVVIDEGQFQQILMNLVVNAADAMPSGGKIEVALCNTTLPDTDRRDGPSVSAGAYVVLTVTDAGSGMDENTRRHLFEPFFTTKPVGKGTGLGLSTVYGTVSQAGGFVTVDSAPDRGATFKVHLPASTERATESDEIEPTILACVRGVAMVCEDDQLVREVTCNTLRASGFTVVEADNGRHALEVAEQHDGVIDLLVTDVIMPEMNGSDMADALAKKHPDMRIVFVSGYASDLLDARRVEDPHVEFLAKPFKTTSLMQSVLRVMGADWAPLKASDATE